MASNTDKTTSSTTAGIAARGATVTGVLGILGAAIAVVGNYDFVGAGACLAASALAFGLLAIANGRER